MRIKLLLFLIVFVAIGYYGSANAQSYGDTKIVSSFGSLEKDWIVTGRNTQGYLLKYVGGARCGDIETVIKIDDLPLNWVVVDLKEIGIASYTVKYIGGSTNGCIQPVLYKDHIPAGWKEIGTLGIYTLIKYEGLTSIISEPGPSAYRFKYREVITKSPIYDLDLDYWIPTHYTDYWKWDCTYKNICNSWYGAIEETCAIDLPKDFISIELDGKKELIYKIKCVKNAKPGDIEYSVLSSKYNSECCYELPKDWIVTSFNDSTNESVILYLGNEEEVSQRFSFGDTLNCHHLDITNLPKNWAYLSSDKIIYIGGKPKFGTTLDIYLSNKDDKLLPDSTNWVWKEYGKTVQYIGNAPFGTELTVYDDFKSTFEVENYQQIPDGWVITSYMDNLGEKVKIKYIKDAEYGLEQNASYKYVENSNLKLPEGWVIYSFDSTKKLCVIKNTKGGKLGYELTLKNLPSYKTNNKIVVKNKPPAGWVVSSVGIETYTISCVENASFGNTMHASSDVDYNLYHDYLPEGWMFDSYDSLNRSYKLIYIKGASMGTTIPVLSVGCIDYLWEMLPQGWICLTRNNSDIVDLKYLGENFPEIGISPTYTFKDLKGNDVKLESFRGKNTVLIFDDLNTEILSLYNENIPDTQFIRISKNGIDPDDNNIVNLILNDPSGEFKSKYCKISENQSGSGYSSRWWILEPTYLFLDKDLKILSKKIQISRDEAIVEAKRLFSKPYTPVIEEPEGEKIRVNGYISINFTSNDKEVLKGFEISCGNIHTTSDSQGHFELLLDTYTFELIISKAGYLDKKINFDGTKQINVVSTKESPIIMLPGDLCKDGAINLKDVLELAKSFSAVVGDANYSEIKDFNRDNAINMADVIIIIKNFNETSDSETLPHNLTMEDIKNSGILQKKYLSRFKELFSLMGADKANEKIISELNLDPQIKQAGLSGNGDIIWFEQANGILGGFSLRKANPSANIENLNSSTMEEIRSAPDEIVNLAAEPTFIPSVPVVTPPKEEPLPDSEQSGPRIATRKVLLLSPMLYEFGANDDNDKSAYSPNFYNTLKNYKYDGKEVFRDSDITYLKDKEVTVSFLRKELYKYGIISISTHGDSVFYNLRSEESWGGSEKGGVCGFFITQGYGDSETAADAENIAMDLQKHRLATFTFYDETTNEYTSNFFVLPSFIDAYFKNTYLNNIILMGSCRSAYNTTLADAFLRNGAKTYLGFDDYIPNNVTRTEKSLFLKSFLHPFSSTGFAYNQFKVGGKVKMIGSNNLKPPVPILDLGTNAGSYSTDINSKGQIIGGASKGNDIYPYMYEDGTRTLLNNVPSWPYSINDSSQICMSTEKEFEDGSGFMYSQGFLWQNGNVKDLGYTRYTDINDKGQIIGYKTDTVECTLKGFTIENGVYKDLGYFLPVDINNKGQIIGWGQAVFENANMQVWSFLYENGVFKDLGSLNKNCPKVTFGKNTMGLYLHNLINKDLISDYEAYGETLAEHINENGQIVGGSYIGDEKINHHAFLWENGVMKDLGTLSGNDQWSYAYDINNDGVVCGKAEGANYTGHAVIWKNGKIIDLSQMATFGVIEDRIAVGRAINDNGQVAGTDFNGNAVLWTP